MTSEAPFLVKSNKSRAAQVNISLREIFHFRYAPFAGKMPVHCHPCFQSV
jgi:hypothetical protein